MTKSEERKQVYAATRQDLLSRQLSNSERFDNAILTLSTGALGISLAFIKDIVPMACAIGIGWLMGSWWLFGAAIISTMLSFIASQLGIKRQMYFAEEYYLNEKDEFLNKKNILARSTDILNYLAGALFLAGILSTVLFVSINFKGVTDMTDKKEQASLGEGATIPSFQKVWELEKKGASIPSLQPVEPSTQPSDQGDQGGQGSGGGAKDKK